jgi:VDE lipocalin domain
MVHHHSPLAPPLRQERTVSDLNFSSPSRASKATIAPLQKLVGSTLLAGMLLVSSLGFALPSFAETAKSGADIGTCILQKCKLELGQCLLNPRCAANLICINTCTGKPDETECQIKCGDLFDNEVTGRFNKCALSQKKCVPQRQDDGTYPVPPDAALVKKFDTSMFQGQWIITAGLNPLFDIFDCQVSRRCCNVCVPRQSVVHA